MASGWEPKILLEAQRHWHRPIGLLLAIVAALLFELAILASLDADHITTAIVYLITLVSLFIIWFRSNRLPKTAKGKVGFVVCIHCSNEEENKRIREDFVATLRNLLKRGDSGSAFEFLEIPQHIAETITCIEMVIT